MKLHRLYRGKYTKFYKCDPKRDILIINQDFKILKED